MPDTPEAVTEKEPYKCWPSQNIHCENSLKLHACLADLKAKGSNEAVLREALEEAGGLISGGVIRRLLGMKARTTEKAEASINAVMDKINAALSAPPIEPVGIRKALRDACSLARGLLLLTKMDGWKNLNKHTDEALLAKCEAALASKDAELAKCANLVAQEARAHGDTKAELAAVVRFVQRVAGDVTRQEPSNPNVLDDGFGNQWLKCSRPGGCGLQIVRPGKVQCDCEQEKQEDGAGDGDMGLKRRGDG